MDVGKIVEIESKKRKIDESEYKRDETMLKRKRQQIDISKLENSDSCMLRVVEEYFKHHSLNEKASTESSSLNEYNFKKITQKLNPTVSNDRPIWRITRVPNRGKIYKRVTLFQG